MRKTAISALLQANRHRIKIVSNESEQPMPPSDVHKPSERVIETSPGEVPHTIYDDPSECDEPLPGEEEENVTTSSLPNPNLVPQKLSQPSSTNATENVANRGLPIGSILGKQLKDEDSSFSMYVNEYVKKRGDQVWGLGHVAGFQKEGSDVNEHEEGAQKKKGSGKNSTKDEKSAWTQRLAKFFQGLLKWLKRE